MWVVGLSPQPNMGPCLGRSPKHHPRDHPHTGLRPRGQVTVSLPLPATPSFPSPISNRHPMDGKYLVSPAGRVPRKQLPGAGRASAAACMHMCVQTCVHTCTRMGKRTQLIPQASAHSGPACLWTVSGDLVLAGRMGFRGRSSEVSWNPPELSIRHPVFAPRLSLGAMD